MFNFEGPAKETQQRLRDRNSKGKHQTRESMIGSEKVVSVSERKRETGAQALRRGGIAQLGEHLLCKQGVNGSIPFISTIVFPKKNRSRLEGNLLAANHGLIAQPVRAHA